MFLRLVDVHVAPYRYGAELHGPPTLAQIAPKFTSWVLIDAGMFCMNGSALQRCHHMLYVSAHVLLHFDGTIMPAVWPGQLLVMTLVLLQGAVGALVGTTGIVGVGVGGGVVGAGVGLLVGGALLHLLPVYPPVQTQIELYWL